MRPWWTILLTSAVLAAEPQTFVVAAGVETYDDPNTTPLRCAAGDAKALVAAFGAAGVPAANLTLLTSDQPDRQRLERGLVWMVTRRWWRGCTNC